MTVEPFFIIGFQRSGTTMLRLMLNAHPEVAIPHDSAELWLNYYHKSRKQNDLRTPQDLRAIVDALLAEPRIKAWKADLPRALLLADPLPVDFPALMRRFHEVYARLNGKRYWGDKNTGTLTQLDHLNRLFPACKFVHLIRDGRDCALSHTSKAYIYGYANILRAALEWQSQVTLCRKMGAMLPPARYLEVKYEDLVAQTEAQLGLICEFLGIAYSPAMLNYHRSVDKNVPDDRRGLWPLLDQPPVAANSGKWKSAMSGGERAVFERNAGALLRELGYETLPAPIKGGRLLELWYPVQERIAWRLRRL